MLVIFGFSMWYFTAYLPPTTAKVAVDQLKDSSESYANLREHELAKICVAFIVGLLALAGTLALFSPEILSIWKNWKKVKN
jgi:hypothetical protein